MVARQHAVDMLIRIIEQTAPLAPSSYTLHIPYGDSVCDTNRISRWQDVVGRSLEKMLTAGIPSDLIAVETLDYPLEIIDQILSEFNLAVCMDLGHLIVDRIDIQSVFNQYSDKVAIIHLHGVEGHREQELLHLYF